MIKKIWKDNFEALVEEGTGVISKEDIDGAVDMVIADRIEPQVFVSNLEVLITGCMSPFNFSGIDKKEPSPSICLSDKPISAFPAASRSLAFPLWFYAAYPDVMKWFFVMQKGVDDSFNDSEADPSKLLKIFEMMGIKEADIEKEEIFFNKEKQWKPEYLKNLVVNYKDKTGKELEVTVEKFSESDMYTGQEMLSAVGTESNFTLIAEITTKFYLELEKNYKDFFADQVGLLAAAGILDAQWYVFSGQVKAAEIMNIAKEAIKSDDPLLNFITELEIKLLGSDTPNMDEISVRQACEEQKGGMKEAIQKIKKEYKGEPRIISDTKMFMDSDKFDQFKENLGIVKKKRKGWFGL